MRLSFRKHKIIISIVIVVLIILAYYSSGYFFIYNNDAYVDADWVKVAFSVPGTIGKVHIKDNQYVKKGTLMIALTPRKYLLNIASAKAQLDQVVEQQALIHIKAKIAKTDIKVKQAQTTLAKLEWQRYKKLLTNHSVSKEQYDEKYETYQVQQAEWVKSKQVYQRIVQQQKVLAAQVAHAVSNLGLAEYHYAQSQLHAPSDGYINNLRIYTGDHAKIGQPLFSLINSHTWRVVANIKETNLIGLHPGKKVWVYLSSHPWHLYHGTVESIAHGVARTATPGNAALPYVEPVTSWIRYAYRFPVRIKLMDFPKSQRLHMGADAKVFAVR